MKIGVLGTGVVGRTLAAKLAELGHEPAIGTRDVKALMERTTPGERARQTFAEWSEEHPGVRVASFAEAADGDIVVNATPGGVSLAVLESVGDARLAGKVLIDVANALDFSGGMPPGLLVAGKDSLAEQIQRRFPTARVVKTLNTVNARVMVQPEELGDGDHHIFVSGDDADAKAGVTEILRSLGWRHIVDLGGLSTARGTEMFLPLWVSLMAVLGSAHFNIKVVTGG